MNETRQTHTTNAVLTWVFSPILSIAWYNHEDKFLREHARNSLPFGATYFILSIVLWFLSIFSNVAMELIFGRYVFGFGLVGVLFSCFWSIVWLALAAFGLIPRIMGAVKAYNQETWEVPYVNKIWYKYFPQKNS